MNQFIPDESKINGMWGNIDWNSLTDATKELLKPKNPYEKIMEYYGLIPFNPKEPRLRYNCNNIAAWDAMRVWAYDIHRIVPPMYEGWSPRKELWIPKEQQRPMLEEWCNAMWLWIQNTPDNKLINKIPNPPEKPWEKRKNNLFGLPASQFSDPNANNAKTIIPGTPEAHGDTGQVNTATDTNISTAGTGEADNWTVTGGRPTEEHTSVHWEWSIEGEDKTDTSTDGQTTSNNWNENDWKWPAEAVQQDDVKTEEWWSEQSQTQWSMGINAVLVTVDDEIELIRKEYERLTWKPVPNNNYGKNKERLISKITEAVEANEVTLEQQRLEAEKLAKEQLESEIK